ncbi:TOBE domain-containing protein [Cupriavidus basilensis]|jgi:molybdate transport system regulatory protein|uniref:TOBE domain-containing protein n=1 Tax=Cupriavidus basilensis TaxID=68895 RepID=UPI0020A6D67F|nr:TOBE domain-containing protein [Cupriavidus basilensis]MCP3025260.1 TOBE domain-containing protein [Cupriavidus basilensis]
MSAHGMRVKGRLWLATGDRSLAGHGRIDLLARIGEFGSITRAAKSIGMSYKAAWDAVDTMNSLAGSLVVRSTGGRGGGGTKLTDRGRKLVTTYQTIEREHQKFLAALSEHIDDFAGASRPIRRLNMKTSARNQFHGKVSQIKTGTVNDEIEIELPGGDKLVAIITQESTKNLGLQVGSDAIALIKAPWVLVATGDNGIKLSARNRLTGTVTKLTIGAVNAEVVIQLSGGNTVCAIITNDSATELGLAEGQPATAIFKASHVIVGVPA